MKNIQALIESDKSATEVLNSLAEASTNYANGSAFNKEVDDYNIDYDLDGNLTVSNNSTGEAASWYEGSGQKAVKNIKQMEKDMLAGKSVKDIGKKYKADKVGRY